MSHSPPAGVMADAMMDDPNDTASDTSPAVPVPAPVAKAEEQPAAPMHVVPANASSSPHDSDHSTYSGPMNTSYPSPTVMGAQLNTAPVAPMPSMPMGLPGMPAATMLSAAAAAVAAAPAPYNVPNATPPSKAYPCGTCSKAFARRSDLARHERIHSGDRPHVCDFEGCGKQFIQRSALTVHQRVHTGEKPHLCERCGKPFSDSSSLARHRRIHSGRRPYKCPYANCQKTFTRRTTLTRHQNHHSGTLEEAARATAEALVRGPAATGTSARSEGEQGSNVDSPISTPSPSQQPMSMSPNSELAAINNLSYISNSSLPAHIRGDVHVSSPASATATAYTANNANNVVAGMRPTSHPTASHPTASHQTVYGPPQALESTMDHVQEPGGANVSPHMGNVDWQSPSRAASPTHSTGGNGYVYPDPEESYTSAGQLFYQGATNMRRPGSPDPTSVARQAWANVA